MTIKPFNILRFYRVFREKKTRFVLLYLFFAFLALGLFYPDQSLAQFEFFNPVGSIVDAVGSAIGWVIANIIIGFFSAFLGIGAILLGWAIDPWFIKYGYTKGGIVDIGWPIVRDLANMMLVLALIAIALGTALRISEYEVRKALPRFLWVALLINFTPVILGVFVDAANIVMNFFLEGFVGADAIKNSFSNFLHGMSTNNIFDPAFWLELMMIGLFSLLAFITFLLYAILFIFRRIAIWIMVIISPLAFVAWIFPVTRQFWGIWYRQFVQWTIIGISAAFFLWLGNNIIALAGQVDFAANVGGVEGYLQEIFNAVAAYGVAILFLVFGYFMTLQTSAIGAGGAIATFEKGRRGVQAWAMKEARQRGTQWASERVLTRAQAEKRTERMTIAGKEIPGTGAARQVVWGVTAPIRRAAEAVKPYALEAQAKAIDEEVERAKKYRTPERLYIALRSPLATRVQKAGVLMVAIENKQLGVLKKLGLKDEEIEAMVRQLAVTAPSRGAKIAKAVPHLADRIAAQLPEKQAKAVGLAFIDEAERQRYQTLARKLYATASPKDIENWSPDMLIDPETKEWRTEALEGIMHWKGAQLGAAARSMHSQFVDKYMAYAESHPERINEAQRRYLERAPAQELGFRPLPPGATPYAPQTVPPPPAWTGRPSGLVIPPQRPRRTRPVETIGEAEETPGTKPSSPKRTRPAETQEETE